MNWNDVGYMVETPYSYPNLTVFENLKVYAKLRKLDNEHITEIIERLFLTPYQNKKANNLSHGNQQRLGIAKALMHRPDLLILDVMFGNKKQSVGFDYAVKFKQDKTLAHIPILMVTAVNIEHPGFNISSQTGGEFLPIDEFIDKPAQPEDLILKTKKLLKQKRSKWSNWPDIN